MSQSLLPKFWLNCSGYKLLFPWINIKCQIRKAWRSSWQGAKRKEALCWPDWWHLEKSCNILSMTKTKQSTIMQVSQIQRDKEVAPEAWGRSQSGRGAVLCCRWPTEAKGQQTGTRGCRIHSLWWRSGISNIARSRTCKFLFFNSYICPLEDFGEASLSER